MTISRQDVRKVSLLARLLLTGSEEETLTSQLGNIVSYVDQLSELDTENVEPMAHPLQIANVFARDEVRPSLPREAALANAPHEDGESFLVPAVLGE